MTVSTVRPDEYPKSLHPNWTDYPEVEPVECYYAPLVYPTLKGDGRRAGHYYRRTDGVWACINCGEPRP